MSAASVKPSKISDSPDSLRSLNAVRLILVLAVGFGYASTMARGPETREWLSHLDHDPSWFGLQALFFLSGYLGWRSLSAGRGGLTYLKSRAGRTFPALALYTLAVASVLYPLLCAPGTLDLERAGTLSLYWAKTVTLLSPGGVMPGALDEQPYMCLIQGTVWTLRWGALAHLGLMASHALGVRKVGLAIMGTVSLVTVCLVSAGLNWAGMEGLMPFAPGARFAYPFAAGALVFAYRDRLPNTAKSWGLIAIVTAALGLAHHAVAWSPMIEVFGTAAWCAAAMAILKLKSKRIANWPALTLPTYLGVWPAAQVWLYVLPDVPTAALVVLTLGTALIFAYAFLSLSSRVFRPPAASQLNRPRTA